MECTICHEHHGLLIPYPAEYIWDNEAGHIGSLSCELCAIRVTYEHPTDKCRLRRLDSIVGRRLLAAYLSDELNEM